ncbi:hypothetical protein EON67_04825 [archaeon]|nr:MAG: hypothetical protein EON67_04825 [archaeon]
MQDLKALSLNLTNMKVAHGKFVDTTVALSALPADAEGTYPPFSCYAHSCCSHAARAQQPHRARAHPAHIRLTPHSNQALVVAGREVMVPLTNAMYVPGTLGKTDEVLVDIGTGFFVGKPLADAIGIMTRKAAMLKSQLDSLSKLIALKQSNLEVLNSNIEYRKSGGAA